MMKRVSEQTTCENPKVSVHMMTYNHEKFIAQAIDSVLMQETDFPVELVIGDDRSTDGTRPIVQEYVRKYPNLIRTMLHERNVGMHSNVRAVIAACRGNYIAFLEGDDYWVDPCKLQKQVRVMEANPRYSMCGSAARSVMESTNGTRKEMGIVRPKRLKPCYELKDFLEGYPMHTSTVMIRKNSLIFPQSLSIEASGDGFIYIFCAEKGPAGYLDEVTSVYRVHSGGIYSRLSPIEKCRAARRTLELMNNYLEGKYLRVLRRYEGRISLGICRQLLESGQVEDAKAVYWESAPRLARYMPFAFFGAALRVYGHRAGPAWRAWDRFTMWAKIRTRLRRIKLLLTQHRHAGNIEK